MDEGKYAFVTLATENSYSKGALVVAHSLKLVKTKAKLAVLVTESVTSDVRDKLNKVFDIVQEVNLLDSEDAKNLGILGRPELGVSFTKIHSWNLTQFEKCVFLDADTLVVKNCDELFENSELSAVPDVGWPDCFNSGVFVFKPSKETFQGLMKMAFNEGSFDGGDQGLLNMYFQDWSSKDINRHLSFIYNMNVNASYTYLPAYNKFGKDVKIVHFLGNQKKPWMFNYDTVSGVVTDALQGNYPQYKFLDTWWKIFSTHVNWTDPVNQLSTDFKELSIAKTSQNEKSVNEDLAARGDQDDSHKRLQEWEKGNIDYMNKDSFSNIQKKLDEAIYGSSKDEKS